MSSTRTASLDRRQVGAAKPTSMDRQGECSLEMRWIMRGDLPAAVTDWFSRFPAELVALTDIYLLDPYLPGLSIKVRDERALEVKMYRGGRGLLEVPGRACGRLEAWEKWSFPHDPPISPTSCPSGWIAVSKRRRIIWFGLATDHDPPPVQQARCAVELTEVDLRGEPWWTLGFETTGAGDQRRELDAAAALLFGDALPEGVGLRVDESQSYMQWLRRQSLGA